MIGYNYTFCYNITDYSENNYKEIIPKKDKTVEQKLIVEKSLVDADIIFN